MEHLGQKTDAPVDWPTILQVQHLLIVIGHVSIKQQPVSCRICFVTRKRLCHKYMHKVEADVGNDRHGFRDDDHTADLHDIVTAVSNKIDAVLGVCEDDPENYAVREMAGELNELLKVCAEQNTPDIYVHQAQKILNKVSVGVDGKVNGSMLLVFLIIIANTNDQWFGILTHPDGVARFNLLLEHANSDEVVSTIIRIMGTVTFDANARQITVMYNINEDVLCRILEQYPDTLSGLMNACPLFLSKADMTNPYFIEILRFGLRHCAPNHLIKFMPVLHEYARDHMETAGDLFFRELVGTGFLDKLRHCYDAGPVILNELEFPEDARRIQVSSMQLMIEVIFKSQYVRSCLGNLVDPNMIVGIVLNNYWKKQDNDVCGRVSTQALVFIGTLCDLRFEPTRLFVELEPIVIHCIKEGSFDAKVAAVHMAAYLVIITKCRDLSSDYMFQYIADMLDHEGCVMLCHYVLVYLHSATRVRIAQSGELPPVNEVLLEQLRVVITWARDIGNNGMLRHASSVLELIHSVIPGM